MHTNKLFFRIGKLDTHIDEVEYKSLIIDFFDKYAGIQLDPEQIRLVENKDYGGYQRFSFVTLSEDDDVDSVISSFENIVTAEGYDLVASQAQDKPRESRNSGRSGGYSRDSRDSRPRRY